jgi:hypothetical protein
MYLVYQQAMWNVREDLLAVCDTLEQARRLRAEYIANMEQQALDEEWTVPSATERDVIIVEHQGNLFIHRSGFWRSIKPHPTIADIYTGLHLS